MKTSSGVKFNNITPLFITEAATFLLFVYFRPQSVKRLVRSTKVTRDAILLINGISFQNLNPRPLIHCLRTFCNVYVVGNKRNPGSFAFTAFPATFGLPW